jgi:CheY-like chemotaxis protein
MARILIVDDHKEIADLYGAILEDDHELDFATTANEAASKAARHQYDLIIMDIALRRSSGVTAALAIRGLGYVGPIVAVTGGLVPSDEALYGRARFAETLTKPVMPEAVRSVVKRFVKSEDAGGPSSA